MTRTHRILAAAGLVALLAGGAAACGDDDDTSSDTTAAAAETTVAEEETTTTEAAAEEIVIEDVWARTSPMMATTGAAYMQITSPVDDRLLSASVDMSVAMMTQIHETTEADDGSGEMVMQEVEAIELPAGETVALEPGGYHIMLMELAAPLEVGSEIEITLELEVAGTVTVTAEVRDA